MPDTNIITAENELLRKESDLLKEKLAMYEQREREEQARIADAALHAQQAREAATAQHEAEEKRRFAELNLPRPENQKAFLALSTAVRSKFYDAYGADFVRELHDKEASGMDWATWDRLNHPERFPAEDTAQKWTAPVDFTDANGVTMHYSDEHRRWFPGPSPSKKVRQ